MSTNLEYRVGERQRKEKSGRPAKLNWKKADRDLETFFVENFVAAVTK